MYAFIASFELIYFILVGFTVSGARVVSGFIFLMCFIFGAKMLSGLNPLNSNLKYQRDAFNSDNGVRIFYLVIFSLGAMIQNLFANDLNLFIVMQFNNLKGW
ncbi:hypothetical protein GCM10011497_37570 [Elstera cyanobacteriorum]|uniref:hypothetical protein n=1 Tax=Elstera cyanobacteriorum TaxID=2022747 RepID=UPI0011403276|nr:hypothetical protein [Elstera cyanobacteriorum]GGA03600.1 hypothetical protein GCM10011497_37570 [Elstera cyanobacteriorum]